MIVIPNTDKAGVQKSIRTGMHTILRLLSEYKWLIIGLLWLAVMFTGYIGLKQYYKIVDHNTNEFHDRWDILYYMFQLFPIVSGNVTGPINWELQLARFLAPALAIYTSLSALALILHEQVQLFLLRFTKNHVVICGLGNKGLPLVEGFLDKGFHVVVIEQSSTNTYIPQCREKGAMILIGNALDIESLKKTRISQAKYLIAACGEDSTNAEIVFHARSLVTPGKGNILNCYAHINDLELCKLLQKWEFQKQHRLLRLEFFNVFESGARTLLDQNSPLVQRIFEIQNSEPHIMVIGSDQMGSSLVINLVRRWKDLKHGIARKLFITVVDEDAQRKIDLLNTRYPELNSYCKMVPKDASVQSLKFEQLDFLNPEENTGKVEAIFVCQDNDLKSIIALLKLNNSNEKLDIPVIVRMVRESGLSSLLKPNPGQESKLNIETFLDRSCTPDMLFGYMYESIARFIHENFCHEMTAKGFKYGPKTSEEDKIHCSLIPFDKLPEDEKEQNRVQAQSIRTNLWELGFDLLPTNDWNPHIIGLKKNVEEILAEKEHQRWVKQKIKSGWRYGPTTDKNRHIHQDILPWDQLSEEAKDKDRFMVRAFPRIVARAGYMIVNTASSGFEK